MEFNSFNFDDHALVEKFLKKIREELGLSQGEYVIEPKARLIDLIGKKIIIVFYSGLEEATCRQEKFIKYRVLITEIKQISVIRNGNNEMETVMATSNGIDIYTAWPKNHLAFFPGEANKKEKCLVLFQK